jgi:hypothetical protein
MRLLSSSAFCRRVYPVLWFGMLGLVMLGALVGGIPRSRMIEFWLSFFALAAFVYYRVKSQIWSLVDEVWDAGDSLIVRNRGQEVRIDLLDIRCVDYSHGRGSAMVKIQLREPCVFGSTLKFNAYASFLPWGTPPIVKELRQRIDIRGQKPATVEAM